MPAPSSSAVLLESGSGILLESGSALLLESSGASTSTVDRDLVAFLSAAIGLPVWAPLRRGNRYRGPANVPDAPVIASYHRIHTGRERLLAGPLGIVEADYQLTLFAQVLDDALPFAELARFALDGYAGSMGSTEVLNAWLDDEQSTWIENEDPKKAGKYRLIQDYRIQYRESVRAR